MLTFNIITLFPHLIEKHLKELPFKKGIKNKILAVNIINLRDFADNKHKKIDAKVYGGGTGMILQVEPIYKAVKSLNIKNKSKNPIILLSPTGSTYNQKKAFEFAEMNSVTLICGRYEGVDARVEDLITHKLSIGNYVLSGGELAALVVMESVTRLLPGILDKEAYINESFSTELLEHPQYTRPEDFMGKKVPKVLLSGDHKKIEEWKLKNSLKSTK